MYTYNSAAHLDFDCQSWDRRPGADHRVREALFPKRRKDISARPHRVGWLDQVSKVATRVLYVALLARRLTELPSCAGRAQRRTTRQLGV
jgi:hypothetical protein